MFWGGSHDQSFIQWFAKRTHRISSHSQGYSLLHKIIVEQDQQGKWWIRWSVEEIRCRFQKSSHFGITQTFLFLWQQTATMPMWWLCLGKAAWISESRLYKEGCSCRHIPPPWLLKLQDQKESRHPHSPYCFHKLARQTGTVWFSAAGVENILTNQAEFLGPTKDHPYKQTLLKI